GARGRVERGGGRAPRRGRGRGGRGGAALRALRQRRPARGEATANTALTDRLVALGARYPRPAGLGLPRRRWPVRSIAAACLTLAGLGLPVAAFLAGGGPQEPGPSGSPAVGMYVLQPEFSAAGGQVRPAPPPLLSSAPRFAGVRHQRAAQPAMGR